MTLRKIERLDPRYLFLILLVVASIPMIIPLGLPMKAGALTEKAYLIIESLPPESVVVIDACMSAGYGPELQTQFVALLRHLLSRPLKVVIVSFGTEGPMLFDMALKGGLISGPKVDLEKYGKVYGVDWVYLGYIPGGETAFASFARDSWMTKVDDENTPLDELPIMQYCKNIDDWSLSITVTGGSFEQYIAQWSAAYGTTLIMGVPGVSAPRLFPYVATGQLAAMLVSLRGAGEYELLIKQPGLGAQLMDILNLTQLLIVLSVIIGNILYFAGRLGGQK